MSTAESSHRGRWALLGIFLIALLPLLFLLLPTAAPAGAPQRLIVLLPGAGDLAQAARLLDAASARPLGQGQWPDLWLVSSSDADATRLLYAAGARLVLDGNAILAGCLGFRAAS